MNGGLWVVTMQQSRSISCDKCTIWGDADSGGGVLVWMEGVCGKSLYLPLSFSLNLKLLKKNKVFIQNKEAETTQPRRWGPLVRY